MFFIISGYVKLAVGCERCLIVLTITRDGHYDDVNLSEVIIISHL